MTWGDSEVGCNKSTVTNLKPSERSIKPRKPTWYEKILEFNSSLENIDSLTGLAFKNTFIVPLAKL